jgi:hypothetical protein
MIKSAVMAGMFLFGMSTMFASCGDKRAAGNEAAAENAAPEIYVQFDADSAYSYVERQVEFGPRVPNTEAHRRCGVYLENELRRHGATVTVQPMTIKAFDGTMLHARNIFGSYNTDASERLLLMAHWDTRPWADNDPDSANHRKPNDGANDGASGVGVLLEIARQLATRTPGVGVDILFVDAEDWGAHNDDDSWALGAEYFVNNMKEGYTPSETILLDMVGGKDARFCREYLSQKSSPGLVERVWQAAAEAGFSEYFVNRLGGAITDDHVKFIENGYDAIDIIEYNPTSDSGFNPVWHTMQDNMENIDAATLNAVGKTLMHYIFDR